MSEPSLDPPAGPPARRHEPVFNAPWPPVALAAAILGAFLLQDRIAGWNIGLALYPYRVAGGDPAGLLTSLFLHGSWAHVFMNSAFCIAFGAPVARLLGLDARGALRFFLFYMACGMLAGLAFVFLHAGAREPVIGASGAVAGLMGAAARLLDRPGELGSPFSRPALSLAAAWLVINVLLSFAPAAEILGGGRIAWEAHLGGFAAGLLLIGPFHRFRGVDSGR